MESLGDMLKRHQLKRNPAFTRRDEAEGPPCARCQGRAWLTINTELVSDPDFGRLIPCDCQRDKIAAEQITRLEKYSGLGELTASTFDTFSTKGLGQEQFDDATRNLLYVTLAGSTQYAKQPVGWLVLWGPIGTGKTHLAAAVANTCIAAGMPVFFAHVPTLLDHLRSAFDPDSEIGHTSLFEQVRDAPILILDELDTDESTPWAHGKLKQIINHRFIARLQFPTIVTTTDLTRPIHSHTNKGGRKHRRGADPGHEA